jgi:PAS domain S-box-containing protein
MAITFEHIFNSTSNGVIATDAAGRIVLINRQAEEILGLHRERVVGTPLIDALPQTGTHVARCLESGEPQLGRHVLGREVQFVANITLIRENGISLGAVCNFQRLQQFETSARELDSYQRLNRQLQAIIDSSFDGIWVCDAEGRVITINEASERLNQVRAQEVVGKKIEDMVKSDIFDRSVTLEVMKSKRQVTITQNVPRTGKKLLVTGTPAFDEQGELLLVVTNERDLTRLNAMRDELEQSRMRAEKFKEELVKLNLKELKGRDIVAESESMQQVLRVAFKLAKLEASNILLLGESGTGKGLLAGFIHTSGRRCKKPFIQINCAALPETLLEAELFGYEKGAFTGAREQGKVGLFELAQGGTLFLDEIGDMPPQVQAKLLKYLDDQMVQRLGGVAPKKVDCTVIAATNRELEALVKRGKFRHDLFFRLNTFTVRIPPLRERPEDVFELTSRFLKQFNQEFGLNRRLSAEALHQLKSHAFPGNVRELKNMIKTAVVMSEEDVIALPILAPALCEVTGVSAAGRRLRSGLNSELNALEREILKTAAANCRTTREMAAVLRVNQSTVVRKMRKHGLVPFDANTHL